MKTRLQAIRARNAQRQNGSGRVVRGIELRYLLTTYLLEHGHANVAELVTAPIGLGFATAGRPSKAVSDALRWERKRARVRKFGRGQYGPGGSHAAPSIACTSGCRRSGTRWRRPPNPAALRDAVASTA